MELDFLADRSSRLVRLADEKPPEVIISPDHEPVLFGPESEQVKQLSYVVINVASQMRNEFDEQEQSDLTSSIRAAGLQNPLIVFEMSPELTEWYVDLCNETWSGEVDVSKYTQSPDGTYFVLVAGERRYRSLGSIIEEDEHDPANVYVTCQVRRCESPLDMMQSQAAENIYSSPRPYQHATIIHELYKLGLAGGLYETEDEFIRGYSPSGRESTKKALAFYTLPEYVRDTVAKNELGYGQAVLLVDFHQAYQSKLDEQDIPADTRDSLMKNMMVSRVAQVAAEGWTMAQLESAIPGWISDLDFDQPGFFEQFLEDQAADFVRVQEKKILALQRDILNGANRALRQHSKALHILNTANSNQLRGVQPHMRRQLETVAELYDSLARTHYGKPIGSLVMERHAEVDTLLSRAEVGLDQDLDAHNF